MSSPSIHKPISCPECGHEMRRVWTEQIQTAIDEFRSETVVAWPHLVCDQCQFKCGIDYDETWSPMQSTILMLSTTVPCGRLALAPISASRHSDSESVDCAVARISVASIPTSSLPGSADAERATRSTGGRHDSDCSPSRP
jgi:hypothetical protein